MSLGLEVGENMAHMERKGIARGGESNGHRCEKEHTWAGGGELCRGAG